MAQTSALETVVMPGITDISKLTKPETLVVAADRKTDRSNRSVLLSSVKGSRLSNSSGVVTVPASMPVGTIISGTTFNVITSDQLSHFKPMLCVDNGFVSGGPSVSDDVKPTHIVIRNNVPVSSQNSYETSTPAIRSISTRSWTETALMPVLPIRCKNTSAELHKQRFGSGCRGRCIKFGMDWYTPSEFEAFCGRASSKDWKRSIRFGGRSIQALIDEGILTPHATSCTCGACCDDETAMGPVRLFIPYKRKKRNQESDEKKSKVKREYQISESDIDSIQLTSDQSSPKETWQTITEGLDSNTEYQLLENTETSADPTPGIIDMEGVLKRLDDIGQSLVRLAGELKQCCEEVRAVSARQLEQERAAALLAASVDAAAHHAPLHSVDDSEFKKCANCNRPASAECSLCRRTPYCSTYCQKKDWAAHQLECLRTVPHDQHQQSIMLIVESPHQ